MNHGLIYSALGLPIQSTRGRGSCPTRVPGGVGVPAPMPRSLDSTGPYVPFVPLAPNCDHPAWEPLFRSIVGRMLIEPGVLSSLGSIIDAGANGGEESCMYAVLSPNRTVHAVEPVISNVHQIRQKYASVNNLAVLHGGLGATGGILTTRRVRSQSGGGQVGRGVQVQAQVLFSDVTPRRRDSSNATLSKLSDNDFPIYRVDDLMQQQWQGEVLAFGHFDVEGFEYDLLRGAEQTILRDRPIFTVETFPQRQRSIMQRLLTYMDRVLKYDMLLVEESCGTPLDCRNIIALPRERAAAIRSLEPLRSAEARHAAFAVDALNASYYAYPCCYMRQTCCSQWPNRTSCCSFESVHAWLSSSDAQHHGNWPAALPDSDVRRAWGSTWAPPLVPVQ